MFREFIKSIREGNEGHYFAYILKEYNDNGTWKNTFVNAKHTKIRVQDLTATLYEIKDIYNDRGWRLIAKETFDKLKYNWEESRKVCL